MSSFTALFQALLKSGKIVSPRGQKTLEIEDAVFKFHPYERFANFPSRKLSLNYIKDEILWYLKGDPSDLSICDKAKIWRDMVTPEQTLNSNYGKYIFRDLGLGYIVQCLDEDHNSRRAIITILGAEHLYVENKDVPCTVSLGFRIRDNYLNCAVHMRSSDAIYGIGNDIPFFSFVQECALVLLNSKYTVPFKMGSLTLFSESLHVYEKHLPMLHKIAYEEVIPVNCPKIYNAQEVNWLLTNPQGAEIKLPFTNWLLTRDPKKEIVT